MKNHLHYANVPPNFPTGPSPVHPEPVEGFRVIRRHLTSRSRIT